MAEADQVAGKVIDDFLHASHGMECVADQQDAHSIGTDVQVSGNLSVARESVAGLVRHPGLARSSRDRRLREVNAIANEGGK